jgi:hypothetical protein
MSMSTYSSAATHRLRTHDMNFQRKQVKKRPQYHHVIARKIDTFPSDKLSDPQAYIGYHRVSFAIVSLLHKYTLLKCWSVFRRSGNRYAQYQSFVVTGRDTLLPAVLRGNCCWGYSGRQKRSPSSILGPLGMMKKWKPTCLTGSEHWAQTFTLPNSSTQYS